MLKNSQEIREARRALVKLFYHKELSTCDIVRRLTNEGAFFSPEQGYRARRAVVERDLEAIQQEDSQWFRVNARDTELALREHLQQQQFLFQQASQE